MQTGKVAAIEEITWCKHHNQCKWHSAVKRPRCRATCISRQRTVYEWTNVEYRTKLNFLTTKLDRRPRYVAVSESVHGAMRWHVPVSLYSNNSADSSRLSAEWVVLQSLLCVNTVPKMFKQGRLIAGHVYLVSSISHLHIITPKILTFKSFW